MHLVPQSHCAESTAERGRIDHSCSVGGSFLVIPGHSGNDNDKDNPFEQCLLMPVASAGQYESFEHVQKCLCIQRE